ncbi:Chitinase 1 [Physocladia obscura]|uniref:Chitinase 1 n=1 Tax=Physocladia obscura TaxID=109957 RepID=A0AAD5STA7_9FUNG|nr:Chitinase 1 [Physocladia obscura]
METSATKRARIRKIVIAGAVVAVVVVVAIVVGVVVSKNKNSSSGTASGNSTSTSANTNGTSSTNSTNIAGNSRRHPFFGYYGANAIANGVDLQTGYSGRATPNFQQPLTFYCNTGYYDVINLAFLNIFGSVNGKPAYVFNIGQRNDTNTDTLYNYLGDGNPDTNNYTVAFFQRMGQEIKQCQAQGVKIVISLGGDKVSNYSFNTGDGELYATTWYNAFLGGSDANTPRPFGAGVVLDGIELDIEKRPNDWQVSPNI